MPLPYEIGSTPTNGTSGTLAGVAPTGTVVTNTVNGRQYIQTGTLASPAWELIGSADVLVTVASSATPAFDASAGDIQEMQMTGNVTSSSITNATKGQRLTLILTQDGTGSRLMTWPSDLKLAGGSVTLTTTASRKDVFTFMYDGTNWRELSRSLNQT